MVAGIFHSGSGIGDQLFRYITVRTLAEEKGYEWGMQQTNNFKGYEFFKNFEISSGPTHFYPKDWIYWNEKDVRDAQGNDIRSFDPEIQFIQENTIIDGSFENPKYWAHNLKNIDKWLQVESLDLPDDLCIISHRGGEYKSVPELYLPDGYWHYAVQKMREINPNMRFQIQTDDPEEAKRIFPEFEVVDNQQISHSKHTAMGLNWRSIRYANYLIVGNSAFSIVPSLLSPAKVILAPRYHARHNIGIWARPSNYYDRYTYISPSEYPNEIYSSYTK